MEVPVVQPAARLDFHRDVVGDDEVGDVVADEHAVVVDRQQLLHIEGDAAFGQARFQGSLVGVLAQAGA